jgi:hypothetical protein
LINHFALAAEKLLKATSCAFLIAGAFEGTETSKLSTPLGAKSPYGVALSPLTLEEKAMIYMPDKVSPDDPQWRSFIKLLEVLPLDVISKHDNQERFTDPLKLLHVPKKTVDGQLIDSDQFVYILKTGLLGASCVGMFRASDKAQLEYFCSCMKRAMFSELTNAYVSVQRLEQRLKSGIGASDVLTQDRWRRRRKMLRLQIEQHVHKARRRLRTAIGSNRNITPDMIIEALLK